MPILCACPWSLDKEFFTPDPGGKSWELASVLHERCCRSVCGPGLPVISREKFLSCGLESQPSSSLTAAVPTVPGGELCSLPGFSLNGKGAVGG